MLILPLWHIAGGKPGMAADKSPIQNGRITATSSFSLASHRARPVGVCLLRAKRTSMLRRGDSGLSRMNLISRCYRSTFTTQPTLGFAFDFWLLCQSSYLLFVRVVNAITFEHIASNSFCLLAGLNRHQNHCRCTANVDPAPGGILRGGNRAWRQTNRLSRMDGLPRQAASL